MSIKEQLANLDLPLHANFVAPVLCKDLQEMGLTEKTHFQWKIQNGNSFIWTTTFDPDHYYRDSEKMIDNHLIRTIIVPAYTSADIEKLIGDLIHICNNRQHEVTPTQYPRIGTRKAPRYADALALIAIELLKRSILKPEHVNLLINQ